MLFNFNLPRKNELNNLIAPKITGATHRKLIAVALLLLLSVIFSSCLFSNSSDSSNSSDPHVSGDWRVGASEYDRFGTELTLMLTLTNVGNEAHTPPGTAFGDNYLILDSSGRKYSPESVVGPLDRSDPLSALSAATSGGDPFFSSKKINPGFSVDLTAVFEVHENAEGLLFQFMGGAFSPEIQFSLN